MTHIETEIKYSPSCKRKFLINLNYCIIIRISLKFVTKGPKRNRCALVHIMTCCWTGDKQLWKPKVAPFSDAHMRHSVSKSYPSRIEYFSRNMKIYFDFGIIRVYWNGADSWLTILHRQYHGWRRRDDARSQRINIHRLTRWGMDLHDIHLQQRALKKKRKNILYYQRRAKFVESGKPILFSSADTLCFDVPSNL